MNLREGKSITKHFIMRNRKCRFKLNEILTSRKEDRKSLFIFLPYNHYTDGFEKIFKDFSIKIANESKKKLYYEIRQKI